MVYNAEYTLNKVQITFALKYENSSKVVHANDNSVKKIMIVFFRNFHIVTFTYYKIVYYLKHLKITLI